MLSRNVLPLIHSTLYHPLSSSNDYFRTPHKPFHKTNLIFFIFQTWDSDYSHAWCCLFFPLREIEPFFSQVKAMVLFKLFFMSQPLTCLKAFWFYELAKKKDNYATSLVFQCPSTTLLLLIWEPYLTTISRHEKYNSELNRIYLMSILSTRYFFPYWLYIIYIKTVNYWIDDVIGILSI